MLKRFLACLFLFVSLLGVTTAVTPATTFAQQPRANCSTENSSFLGFPTWYKFLEPNGSSGECKLMFLERENSLISALPRILLAVFEIILRISGVAAVGFVIYGGIQYIMSQGEPERTKASKNTIVNALVGLVIALLATAIVNLIGSSIT